MKHLLDWCDSESKIDLAEHVSAEGTSKAAKFCSTGEVETPYVLASTNP